jgi:hypothetical protein
VGTSQRLVNTFFAWILSVILAQVLHYSSPFGYWVVVITAGAWTWTTAGWQWRTYIRQRQAMGELQEVSIEAASLYEIILVAWRGKQSPVGNANAATFNIVASCRRYR